MMIFLAFSSGIAIGLTGLVGMRVLAAVSITGHWPRKRSDWMEYLVFVTGPVRRPRFQIYSMPWFWGCGVISIVFTLGVMLFGRWLQGDL
ncbi:hypothetical protein LXT21_07210 [Myxococcus sp. K38C18041901]|uniref:hypothetical protein n=1 Tax=Myxococcus guangdongensis TaxID=2906760 RepID=UPI0020A7B785|nr:hypothetical protein [Myxococcus guangdongensis]MCP3058555.1 hypothetical protein [Myxococcus guangdongensis]